MGSTARPSEAGDISERLLGVLRLAVALDDRRPSVQATLEALQIRICHMDPSLRMTTASGAFRSAYGLFPDEAIGLPVREVIGGGNYAAAQYHLRSAMRGNRMAFRVEAETKTGRITTLVKYLPFHVDGEQYGVVGMATSLNPPVLYNSVSASDLARTDPSPIRKP